MSEEPTLHSLYEFMRDMREEHGKKFEEIKGKQDVTNVKIESFEQWRVQHEADDKVAHAHLHTRISDSNTQIENTNKRFNNVAIVSALIGFVIGSAGAIKKFLMEG